MNSSFINSNYMKWIYKWVPITFGCHQKPERSFFIKGIQMPICARCTGELIGIIIACFTYRMFDLSVGEYFILMLPLIIDGFLQKLTKYESNNIKRVVTGFLFGYALLTIFVMTMEHGYNYGVEIGQELRANKS